MAIQMYEHFHNFVFLITQYRYRDGGIGAAGWGKRMKNAQAQQLHFQKLFEEELT
jgi:hypothetical protein